MNTNAGRGCGYRWSWVLVAALVLSVAVGTGGAVASGGAGSAAGNATEQLLDTGRIDGGQLATQTAVGAALGGIPLGRLSRGGAKKGCSFDGATVVLMASGSKEPIEDVDVGDMVIATDPETGEQVAKRVEYVFVHEDSLTDLALADGSVLTTTEDHPYWSVDDQRFERADELAPGERVLGADGRTVEVSGLQLITTHGGLAYNLTIEGIHTYHVGDDAILVHNECGPTLIYEANPKHGALSRPGPRGEISRAPRGDCQAMLECSTLIKPKLRQGVEPDTGLQIIFRRHREFDGTEWWHGYVPGG